MESQTEAVLQRVLTAASAVLLAVSARLPERMCTTYSACQSVVTGLALVQPSKATATAAFSGLLAIVAADTELHAESRTPSEHASLCAAIAGAGTCLLECLALATHEQELPQALLIASELFVDLAVLHTTRTTHRLHMPLCQSVADVLQATAGYGLSVNAAPLARFLMTSKSASSDEEAIAQILDLYGAAVEEDLDGSLLSLQHCPAGVMLAQAAAYIYCGTCLAVWLC